MSQGLPSTAQTTSSGYGCPPLGLDLRIAQNEMLAPGQWRSVDVGERLAVKATHALPGHSGNDRSDTHPMGVEGYREKRGGTLCLWNDETRMHPSVYTVPIVYILHIQVT